MKVFAVSVDANELKKRKSESLKTFPIPMPESELERLTAYCKEHGIRRCEWARRVLLASFEQIQTESRAG